MDDYLVKIKIKSIKTYLTRLSIFTDSCLIFHGKLRGVVIDVKDCDGYIASPNLCWILYRKKSNKTIKRRSLEVILKVIIFFFAFFLWTCMSNQLQILSQIQRKLLSWSSGPIFMCSSCFNWPKILLSR